MNFSLDNPGFTDTISSMQDAPESSGSSSASSAPPQCSCAKCHARMSSIDRAKHLIYVRCQGYEYSVDLRCEECNYWSKEEMLSHESFANHWLQNLRAGESLLIKLQRSLPLLLRLVPR